MGKKGRKSLVNEPGTVETFPTSSPSGSKTVLESLEDDNLVNLSERCGFLHHLPQDLTNYEVFTMLCPKNVDVSRLPGKMLCLDDGRINRLKTEDGKKVKFEADVSIVDPSENILCVLPDDDGDDSNSLVTFPLMKHIKFTLDLSVPDVSPVQQVGDKRIPFPEGVRSIFQRKIDQISHFSPGECSKKNFDDGTSSALNDGRDMFGSSMKKEISLAQYTDEVDSRKTEERWKKNLDADCSLVANTSFEMMHSSKKKKKKHKTRDNDDCLNPDEVHASLDDSRTYSEVEFASEKKKRKLNVEIQREFVHKLKKKTQKDRNYDGSEFVELTKGNDEGVFALPPDNDRIFSSPTEKKHKKRLSNHPEIEFDSTVFENIGDEQMLAKSSKKKKEKHRDK